MEDLADKMSGTSEILIFKTSLQTTLEVRFISGILNKTDGIEEWSVDMDMDDWESILRIKSNGITADEIKEILYRIGIDSKELIKQV